MAQHAVMQALYAIGIRTTEDVYDAVEELLPPTDKPEEELQCLVTAQAYADEMFRFCTNRDLADACGASRGLFAKWRLRQLQITPNELRMFRSIANRFRNTLVDLLDTMRQRFEKEEKRVVTEQEIHKALQDFKRMLN